MRVKKNYWKKRRKGNEMKWETRHGEENKRKNGIERKKMYPKPYKMKLWKAKEKEIEWRRGGVDTKEHLTGEK